MQKRYLGQKVIYSLFVDMFLKRTEQRPIKKTPNNPQIKQENNTHPNQLGWFSPC